jgi:hypothetical protein
MFLVGLDLELDASQSIALGATQFQFRAILTVHWLAHTFLYKSQPVQFEPFAP